MKPDHYYILSPGTNIYIPATIDTCFIDKDKKVSYNINVFGKVINVSSEFNDVICSNNLDFIPTDILVSEISTRLPGTLINDPYNIK